jgi:hypothetical protein
MNREQLEGARRLFFILLGADIVVTAIIAISNIWGLGVLGDIQTGRREVTPALLSTLNFWDGFGKLAILSSCAVGVGLVKWLNACYRFASEALGATGFKNEGWTVVGWIIPVFNVFKPYQIINELYRAGSKLYRQPDDWKKESGSGFLLTWWIYYAVTHFFVAMLSKQLLRDMWRDDLSLKQSIGLIEISTVICVISITIAFLWFWVANFLTQRLLARSVVSGNSLPLPASQLSAASQGVSAVRAPGTITTVATSSIASAPTRSPVGAAKAVSPPPVSPQTVTVDEDTVYAAIADELETSATDKGLWTRLFAECDGDENRTKAAYIKQRAEKLLSAERARLEEEAELRAEEEGARTELMKKISTGLVDRVDAEKAVAGMGAAYLTACKSGRTLDVKRMVTSRPMLLAVRDSEGNTGLHIAVSAGHKAIAACLVEHGIYKQARTNDGVTALEMARQHGLNEIVELIEHSGSATLSQMRST